jgi:hypothetical protein
VRRADHSSRGFLPNVVCLSVIAKPRNQIETSQEKKSYIRISYDNTIWHMGFIVDKVALRQVFSFGFLLSFLFHKSCVLIHSSFSDAIKSRHLAPFLNNILVLKRPCSC